jgi:hypothetical protein
MEACTSFKKWLSKSIKSFHSQDMGCGLLIVFKDLQRLFYEGLDFRAMAYMQ